jgi:hypothetical protein
MKERVKHLEAVKEDLEKKVRPDDWISTTAARRIGELEVRLVEVKGQYEAALLEKRLEVERAEARAKNQSMMREAVEVDLDRTLKELNAERAAHADAKKEGVRLAGELAATCEQLEAANATIAAYRKSDRSRDNVIKRTLKLEGKIWTQDVLAGAPPFVGLDERRTPRHQRPEPQGRRRQDHGVGVPRLGAGASRLSHSDARPRLAGFSLEPLPDHRRVRKAGRRRADAAPFLRRDRETQGRQVA